jgi:hypothetical protein
VVGALAVMVDAAKNSGHLTGMVPHLVPGGVSLLQYADHTVVLLECSDSNILHLKFLLYYFENMLGMKINYHKSEVFVVGCEIYEQERVAHMLNCKLGKLSIVYLGMPIGESRLCNDLLILLVGKMLKRMDPWQGKLMSLTTRLTLSNACLANIVMFQLGFYLFGEGVHSEMDRVRGRFFWEGCGPNFKYHMMKWENVCRPKYFGVLGLLNTIYAYFLNSKMGMETVQYIVLRIHPGFRF